MRLIFELGLREYVTPCRTPPAALVASTLAHSIKNMCSDTLDTRGEMPNLPERHC